MRSLGLSNLDAVYLFSLDVDLEENLCGGISYVEKFDELLWIWESVNDLR